MRARPWLVAAVAALTLALVAGSMGWRLVHDTALMQYVAWRLTEGATLYKDIYELDLPGVFLLHALLLKTLGGSDLAWRVFDLGFMAACAGLIVAFGRRLGDTWSAIAAALLFCLYHLAGGASDMGQRDYLMTPFLLAGAYGVARFRADPTRWGPLLWGGLAVGVTLTLKPFAAVLVAALAVVAALAGWPRFGAMVRHGAVFGAGAAVPNLLIYGWLWSTGALGVFLEGLFGFMRTHYAGNGAPSLGALFVLLVGPYAGPVGRAAAKFGLPEVTGWVVVLGTLGAAIAVVALHLRGREGAWHPIARLGLVYGLIHVIWQNKGFGYHTYPLVAFACLLASALLAAGSRKRLAVGATAFVAIASFLGAKAVIGPDRPWVAAKLAVADGLTSELRPIVEKGGRVQVMDLTGGGFHALYQLRSAAATRHMYDYPLYYQLDEQTRAMRAEYLADMQAAAPAAIVMFREVGLRHSYARLHEFPALERWMQDGYRVAVERSEYRLYVKK